MFGSRKSKLEISIEEIRSAIRRKEIDPLDIVEELLERIKKYDGEIKAYVEINQNVTQEAEEVSRLRDSSFGIPFSIKDLIDTKGIVTAFGAKAFRGRVPKRDAVVVKQIKEKGGLILGKTNTHQFALGLETPPTKNPWDLTRIPGGSSGGSAAAVSADLALVALGTDTGGSIRIPACMCGVTGLKPTYGKISTKGVFPTSPSMDHVGPICRFASDLPFILGILGYRIERSKSTKKPAKVAVVKKLMGNAKRDVRSAIRKSINVLESERFAEIDEIELPEYAEICRVTEIIDTFETARVHRKRYLVDPKQYQKTARGLIQAGLHVQKKILSKSKISRLRLSREYAALMKKYPIIMFPTLPVTAPRPDEIRGFSSDDFLPLVRPLEIFDLLGYPSISVPCGFANGLPVGAHFASFSNHDDMIIRIAIKYQSVTSWHTAVKERYGGLLQNVRINS